MTEEIFHKAFNLDAAIKAMRSETVLIEKDIKTSLDNANSKHYDGKLCFDGSEYILTPALMFVCLSALKVSKIDEIIELKKQFESL